MQPPNSIIADMLSSGGTPEDFTQQQLSALADHLRTDLFLFAWVVFGYHDLDPQLHGQLCKLIEDWGKPGMRRLVIQIPRGHFKTSICTIANSTWQAFREPNQPVVIFNEKEENAAMWVRAMKQGIASSRVLQACFPDQIPPGLSIADRAAGKSLPKSWRWTDTAIDLVRDIIAPEPSIQAMGVGSASAGRHWPKVIKDDLISEDAKHSPVLMQRARDWLDNSFALEKPALGGQDLIACTPWAYDDVYAYALRKYDYKLYRRSALEGGEPIFPKMFDKHMLRRMRNRDPYHFSSQMMCLPRPGRDQAFQDNWLRWGTVDLSVPGGVFRIERGDGERPWWDTNPAEVPEPPSAAVALSQMDKCILVDPAPTEEADKKRERYARTAIVVEGIDWWGRRYILDTWAAREAPPDVIDRILLMAEHWGVVTVGIEKVAFSVLYRHWLQERIRRTGVFLQLRDLEPGKRNKDARILTKITPMRAGHYFVNRAVPDDLIRELLEFPYGTTRDILDALAYDDEPGMLRRPASPEERDRESASDENWRTGYRGVSPVTGY